MRRTGMRHPVVVGVDGSRAAKKALLYAVREAAGNHCGLRLVHAYPQTVPMAPMLPFLSQQVRQDRADEIVREAIHYLDTLPESDVPLDVVITGRSPVRALLDAAEDAREVVLGRRATGRMVTASTILPVVAGARCQVTTVPAEWNPDHPCRRVVVGVEERAGEQEAVGAAFEAASARGASLTVVHAWDPPRFYFKTQLELEENIGAWEQAVRLGVAEVMAGWRERFPDVAVDVRLAIQPAVDALADESEHADLLVVGHHGAGLLRAALPGSVARAMVTAACCPVAIVPDRRSARARHSARAADLMIPTY